MEGKSVILNVLIVSLVLAQIQVEATICCPNKEARTAYNFCRLRGSSSVICVVRAGCKLFDETNCPSDYPKDNLQILGGAVNEYCKLGCESSVCGALTTLKNSGGASEIMSRAVEQCTKSCSILCSKGSIQPALES